MSFLMPEIAQNESSKRISWLREVWNGRLKWKQKYFIKLLLWKCLIGVSVRRRKSRFPPKKVKHPGLFFVYFSLFEQTSLQFLQQICVKMYIQYSVLVFKPTTFRMWVSSQLVDRTVNETILKIFVRQSENLEKKKFMWWEQGVVKHNSRYSY